MALSRKYGELRKDSKFKIHPEGYKLFIAAFSGRMDGEKTTTSQIASILEISPTAVSKMKSVINRELTIDWTLYDLEAIDAHFKALKEVAEGIPDIVYRPVDREDGSTDLVQIETSPTKWIATQHREIYKQALTMMDELREETKNAAWTAGKRRYFDSRAYTTYAMFMDKVRVYGRDWLDMFGRLEESAITDAILKRRGIIENTTDFLLDHMGEVITPALITSYVELLGGKITQAE